MPPPSLLNIVHGNYLLDCILVGKVEADSGCLDAVSVAFNFYLGSMSEVEGGWVEIYGYRGV